MLDRLLGKYMVEKGILTKDQLRQVYHLQEANRAKLGVIAVSEKLMSIAQAEQVNALQATVDKRFGDIAIEKGYLTESQVARLLELHLGQLRTVIKGSPAQRGHRRGYLYTLQATGGKHTAVNSSDTTADVD